MKPSERLKEIAKTILVGRDAGIVFPGSYDGMVIMQYLDEEYERTHCEYEGKEIPKNHVCYKAPHKP